MLSPTPPVRVVLYGAEGCHLCEDARAVIISHLASLAASGAASAFLEVVDIHADEALTRAFMETIPVIEAGGERLELATSPARIRAFLDTALNGVRTSADRHP